MLTAIDLCSRALIKIGASSIAAFDEGTTEATVANAVYQPTLDALLSSHPWNFATAQVTLAKLAAVPVADFANAYQLPPGVIRILSVGEEGAGRGAAYRIAENRLHTDAEPPLVLTYIMRPPPDRFPAMFAQALVSHLAAEMAVPITDDLMRAQLMLSKGEMELSRARLIDAQEEPPQRLDDFGLIGARG